jgi:ABC-type sugar transport system permease subunit
VIIGIFTVIPIIMTFIISLHRWSMFTPITRMTYVGFANYARVLSDPNRLNAGANTLVYVGLSLLITLPLAVAIAMLLYFPQLRGKSLIRTLLFATYVIPTIAIVITFGNIYAPKYGPLSTIITGLGLPSPGFLSDPRQALVSLVIFNVWQMLGYYVILLVAGLTQIPSDLFEAASLDGAGPLRRTIHIVLPLLRRPLAFVALMTVINSIQVFDPIYLMTMGGPAGSTVTLSYEIQRQAFQYGLAGDASALAVLMLGLVVFIGGLLAIFMRRRAS